VISFRAFLTSVFCIAFFCSLSTAQDLAKYRDFHLGTTIEFVAKQVQMKASDARTLHERPALIQTLEWYEIGYSDAAGKADSIRISSFDF